MKPISSAIGGLLNQVETQQKSTGLQLGGLGFGIAETDRARAWLAVQASPPETDHKLRTWLQSSQGVELIEETENRYPADGGWHQVVTGYRMRGSLTDHAAAYQKFKLAMTPPTRTQAEELVVLLTITTAGRNRSQAGNEMAMDVYANLLGQYPFDVAKSACEAVALTNEGGGWFPELGKLKRVCDELVSARQMMLEAVERRQYLPEPKTSDAPATARDWLYAAAQAEAQLTGYPKPDIDTQSELQEFIATAKATAKAIRIGERA